MKGPNCNEEKLYAQAARSIYIDMRYDFRNWKEAIKEGDSFDQQKYRSRITIDLENNLDKYPDANRDSIRRKVHDLNLDDD